MVEKIAPFIIAIFVFSVPFILGAMVVKIMTGEDIKYYLFDRTALVAISLYILIITLAITNTKIASTLFVGAGFRGRYGSSPVFLTLPGMAASWLVFGRVFLSEYSVKNIQIRFWKFLAWCFLILIASGLIYLSLI